MDTNQNGTNSNDKHGNQSNGNSFHQREQELKGEMKNVAQNGFEAAKERVKDGAQAVSEAFDQAKDKGSEMMDRAKQKGEELLDDAKDMKDEACDDFVEVAKSVDTYAHRNPWKLVALAALSGLAAGLLCHKSRKCRF